MSVTPTSPRLPISRNNLVPPAAESRAVISDGSQFQKGKPGLSSQTILDLVKTGGPSSPGWRGKVVGLKQFGLAQRSGGVTPGTHNEQSLIRDLTALDPVSSGSKTKYRHPEREAKEPAPGRKGQPLSASDLAWLQRLPSDPAQISYQDAVQVGTMMRATSSVGNSPDRRLVKSIWAPLKELHDRRAAEVAVRVADEQPQWSPPSSLYNALADALQAETPGLTDEEAYERARQKVRDAAAARLEAQDAAVSAAQAQVDGVTEATANRTSTTKPSN